MLAYAAFRNVARNMRRSAVVMITVALGVWSLLFLDAFNRGALERLRDVTVHARHANGEVGRRGFFQEAYDTPQEHWIEKADEIEARLRAIPGVAATFPRVSFPALLTNGHVSIGALGQGIDAARERGFFHALNVVQGTALDDAPDGAILGRGLAAALDVKPGDVVTLLGTTIHGTTNSTEVVVKGVFHTGSPDFDDRIFRLPIAHARSFLDSERVETIAVALVDDRDEAWPPVARAVAAAFPELEAKSYAELDEVNYVHTRDWLASQAGIFRLIVGLLVFFGVVNAVAAGVLERRNEIGILRANGESRRDVLVLFALEALIAGALGAALGVAIHVAMACGVLSHGILLPPPSGQTREFLVLLSIDGRAAFSVAVTAVFIAISGTVVASLRAVRTTVGEALRAT